jgi:uncharacterized damage-inducible protein DinB
MLKLISDMTAWNAALVRRGVEDVAEARMCHQHVNLPNHPAWQVGHLAAVRASVAGMLGRPFTAVDGAWLKRFAPGSVPSGDAAAYPKKAELLDVFAKAQDNLAAALIAADERTLAAPNPIEPLRAAMPTLGQLALTLTTTHDGMHVGQLSDWRRAEGLPRLL